MAKALIESMTAEWEPAKYKDQYRAAVMELIEEKASKGHRQGSRLRPGWPRTWWTWSPSCKKACKRLERERRSQKAPIVSDRRPRC